MDTIISARTINQIDTTPKHFLLLMEAQGDKHTNSSLVSCRPTDIPKIYNTVPSPQAVKTTAMYVIKFNILMINTNIGSYCITVE
jgi:hypothetical protein